MKLPKSLSALAAAASISVVGLVGGCGVGQNLKPDKGADIPPGALPDPPGAHLQRFDEIQKSNAEALSYVIFLNEWYMGGKNLGPYGDHHLQQIARLLPSVTYPVLIQPSLDPAMNDYRRALIVGRLLQAGVTDAEVRVRIEYAHADGVFGEEATPIFRNMLRPGQGGGQGNGQAGTYFPGTVGGTSSGGGGGTGYGGIP